ncbi:hypothetical protein Cgig2_033931 [Carnegiea gigantea]|uniref:Uncharacterized protein n=1 Tax=Carnegiea gigantea TaxID=171969 RepID=A0A9Q1JJ36_9CARY|nr:hypothetical protein Cgig2_033931 [Carnegiea gigantea]
MSFGAPKIGKKHDGNLDRGDHGDEFKRDFIIYEHVNWEIHKHGQLHLSKAINKLITIPVEASSVSIPSVDRIQVDHPLHTKGKIAGMTNHTGILILFLSRREVLFENDVEEDDLKFWLNQEEMMSMAAATEHLERILLDAWFKVVDDEKTLSAEFNAFIRYMYKTLHPQSCRIKEFVIEYLEPSWQDEVNVHDYSIFLMHHMESYQGQHSSCWDAGFGKENKLLRPMYCAQILMHPINKFRMTMSETAKKYFQEEQ